MKEVRETIISNLEEMIKTWTEALNTASTEVEHRELTVCILRAGSLIKELKEGENK